MRSDYIALKSLEAHHGYAVLQALWMHELTKIEEARDSAAKRGSETAWRYFAGQEKGAKLMMTQMQRSLAHMESEGEDSPESGNLEALMQELRS